MVYTVDMLISNETTSPCQVVLNKEVPEESTTLIVAPIKDWSESP
jgi:hypothetical protein